MGAHSYLLLNGLSLPSQGFSAAVSDIALIVLTAIDRSLAQYGISPRRTKLNVRLGCLLSWRIMETCLSGRDVPTWRSGDVVFKSEIVPDVPLFGGKSITSIHRKVFSKGPEKSAIPYPNPSASLELRVVMGNGGGDGNEMTKAMQRIEAFCDGTTASELKKWLSKAQMWANSAAFLYSLAMAVDKDTLLDHLATLRYGLIFRSLGFLPSFEPTGSQGHDLLIARDGTSATVEVTRFKAINPGCEVLSKEEYLRGKWPLEPYGNSRRDVAKSLRKVRDKFRQATAPHAIVAVWNDDEALENLRCAWQSATFSKIRVCPPA